MDKFRNQQLTELKTLFKEFTSGVIPVLAKFLDANLNDFTFSIVDIIDSPSLEAVNETNYVMYKFEIIHKGLKSPLLVLAPEELLLIFSDILMGGKGDVDYTGSLSEVQINSSQEIILTILKDIKEVILERYKKVASYTPGIQIIKKSDPEFAKNIGSDIYNFRLEFIFNVQKRQDFKIYIISNEEQLKNYFMGMDMLSLVDEVKVAKEPMKNLSRINDVKIKLTAELGKTKIPIKKTLELGRGSIIELDRLAGEDIKIYANGVEVADAKVVAVDDHFGVQITKIITKEIK